MQYPAGRRKSASRVVAFSTFVFALAACSSDSPGVLSPDNVQSPSLALDGSNGPVTAIIKSGWLDSKCVTIRNGSMYDGARAELQPCANSTAQKFEFASGGLIKIGSDYCLDAYTGNGNMGDRVVIWGCHGRANQQWTLTSAGQIKGINGLCISFRGHPNDGTTLYIDACRGGDDSQKWDETVVSSPSAPTPIPTSIAASLTSTSITVSQTSQATATVKDANGNALTGQTVTWSSSNPSVASITAAGVATALAVGTTTITAQSGSLTSNAVVLTVTSGTTSQPPSGGSCSVVTGTAARSQSALAKPGYLQSVIEPDFGTTITRITGDPGTAIGNGVSGTWPTVAYHNYSKDPAWTADQRLLVLKQMKGTGFALFLDGATYQPLFSRGGPPGGGEWRLHPRLADVAVSLAADGAVRHWNVRANSATVKVAAVAGYTGNELGPSEGNLSADGRYLVAKAVRSSDSHLVARVLDVDGGSAGPVIDLTAAGVTSLDWVSVSAGGGFVVAYGAISGGSQRTKVWARATGAAVGYWPDYTFGHYDLGFDAAGNEVAFGAVGQSPYAHHFIARRLDSGAITDLTGGVTSYNWHAGTRNTARAGWGYAATNDRTGYALDGEIYAVRLDGAQRVERYAHHRANNIDYDSAPFPTPSPDGKRVVFASNWGASGGRPIQTYVVDVRPICP